MIEKTRILLDKYRCVVCDGKTAGLLYETEDFHNRIEGKFTIVKCSACDLESVFPPPKDSELAKYYPPDYYSFQDFTKPETLVKSLARRFAMISLGTKDPKFPNPGRMLDIGCGSGATLYKYKLQGWEVYGVELSRQAAIEGNRIAQLNIVNSTLIDAKFPASHFDFVRSNHSFEHLTNPVETLKEIGRILRPNGKLFIGVPNTAGSVAKLFGKHWWYRGAPVHTFGYCPANLKILLERHGFIVDAVTYNSDFSGILGSIQISLNRNSGRKSIDGLVFNSQLLKLIAQRLAKLLDVFGRGDAIEVTASSVARDQEIC